MVFCSNCGAKLAEGAKFCANCGIQLNGASYNLVGDGQPQHEFGVEQAVQQSNAGSIVSISDKWAWAFGCVPIFILIFELLFPDEFWVYFVAIGINIVFFLLDRKELAKASFDSDGWVWLGVIIVPVYLFLRASKTTKKYGYAIAWCVLFAASIIISL